MTHPGEQETISKAQIIKQFGIKHILNMSRVDLYEIFPAIPYQHNLFFHH